MCLRSIRNTPKKYIRFTFVVYCCGFPPVDLILRAYFHHTSEKLPGRCAIHPYKLKRTDKTTIAKYSAVSWKRSQFSLNPTKKIFHRPPMRASYGLSFANLNSDLYSTSFTTVLYGIFQYIGSCFNGAWLYNKIAFIFYVHVLLSTLGEPIISNFSPDRQIWLSWIKRPTGEWMPM